MSSVASTRPSIGSGIGAQGTMPPLAGSDYRITMNGAGGHGSGSGSKKAPFRHIDDLVSVGVDLDPHTPLRKVLDLGDAHMRQAITYNDFRRPDLALQEYIKAFTIAVDKIPRHKDYPSMKSDRGDMNRRYNTLKTKLTSNVAIFDKIKEDIKEDNRRSGVQPAASSKSSFEVTHPISSNASPKEAMEVQANGSSDLRQDGPKDRLDAPNEASMKNQSGGNGSAGPKPKPPIQPKPQALHGKAIKQIANPAPQDIVSRFARLRDSQRPGTDMKVGNQNQPAAPAEFSPLHQSLALLDTSTPAMPKPPEAIYSPARGTVTSEVADLPSSAPRGMFSRTNTTVSAPSTAAWASTENAITTLSRNQFVTAHAYQAPLPSTSNQLRIPAGDTITPQALGDLMNQKHPKIQILVIDVRDRESFDEGHINHPGTICVEPEVLMRENISADDIADSMVLAPPNERLAFEQRDRVDLVVIYDQSSASVPARITGNSLEMILYNLRQALSYYSYNRPLKNSPKLLRGGLSSWIYEFGEQFLEASDTAPKHPPTSARFRQNDDRGRYRAKTRTLSQNEINQFENLIKEDQTGTSEFDYIKTREDFIRRYPSITGAPESMTSPVDENEAILAGIAPAPPRRPAPTITRTRYSGLDSRDDAPGIGGIAMKGPAESARAPKAAVARISRIRTGLVNNGNACYCNSTIQALLASPGFIDDILEEDWPVSWRSALDREPTKPQLLAKILKNLFQWMHKKEFEAMKVTTLMSYMRSVHEGFRVGGGNSNAVHKLGDGGQHDIDELTNFIFVQLAAETDVTINFFIERPDPPKEHPNPVVLYMAREYLEFWYRANKFTFVDRHFSGFNVNRRICLKCRKESYQNDSHQGYIFTPEAPRGGGRVRLEDMISADWGSEDIEVTCDSCGHNWANIKLTLAKMPRLLRVYIRRYKFNKNGTRANKQFVPVEFPLSLDLAPYAWDQQTRREAANMLGANINEGFDAPTQYELYAIQVHQGTATNAGHYWTIIRGENAGEWIRLEDTNVTVIRAADWNRELQDLYDCPATRTPCQLFYKRIDIPYEWERQ
ncbi:cysteine proteinase [Hypoxylon sp. FL0543]|nr:cysteine proteinase [Hypoxylon sp. FL0543]